ncbi:3'-5' exonuclease [Nocardia sp. NPDC051463]|uniref:3'-5' exonuclease n=1 Tax=Nocardia sp. NPDC051463 TaxID=3154845 RepID=UPI00344DBA69
MANLVLANNKTMPKIDGSIKDKVCDFFDKLRADDTAPGLHIEPLRGALDTHVRTGRVDLNYRAVMFRVDDRFGEPTYIYLGTWKHDVANKVAEKATLRVNPINGVLESIVSQLDGGGKRPDVPRSSGQAAAQPTLGYLAGAGYTLEQLTDRLGLDTDLAAEVLSAQDQDGVFTVAQAAEVAWQQNAILELAVGRSIDDIRNALGLAEPYPEPVLDENEQILAALTHPASRMQFTLVDDNDELRRVIEGVDFTAWRTFLHPNQRRFVEQDQRGAFRLSGGAGTGKTIVALHRAHHLARQNPGARIVLTTFNKTLAQGLRDSLVALDPTITLAVRPGERGVYVTGIDGLAAAHLRSTTDLDSAFRIVFGADTPARSGQPVSPDIGWAEAISSAEHNLDRRLAQTSFLSTEYVNVVLGNQVTTQAQYLKVPRAGRGVRLSRPQRIAVWQIITRFRKLGRVACRLSFPEVLALATADLQLRAESTGQRVADHVIVDEAQDLHATHWTLLRALVAEGPNDLFIAEDSHQRIYGQPVVLSRLGINIRGGRNGKLTHNYRTTAQNLHFAVSILEGTTYHDLEEGEESTAGYTSARLGPAPALICCDSAADELQAVADQVTAWTDEDGISPGEIAVLARTARERDFLVRALNERGVAAEVLGDALPTASQVAVLTMHRSKGMEFRCVVLVGIDQEHVPPQQSVRDVPAEERDEAEQRERSLLYVAASRARDQLVVTWSGQVSDLLA